MVQVIELSHEQKVEMYMQVSKEQLIEMLIQANIHLISKPLNLYETNEKDKNRRF